MSKRPKLTVYQTLTGLSTEDHGSNQEAAVKATRDEIKKALGVNRLPRTLHLRYISDEGVEEDNRYHRIELLGPADVINKIKKAGF